MSILPTGEPMRNPYASKNPFMSGWLSAANRAMGSARGQATAESRRQVAALQAETTKQMVDFWSGTAPVPARRKKKRKSG